MWTRIGAGFLWHDSATLGLMQTELRRTALPEHKRTELGVRKLRSQYLHYAASSSWLCAYAEKQRRKMPPDSSFVPTEASS